MTKLQNAEPKTTSITAHAAYARINRALAHDDQRLRTARSQQMWLDCGWFYVIDCRHNLVLYKDVNLETFGKELGVIKKWETVQHDDQEEVETAT